MATRYEEAVVVKIKGDTSDLKRGIDEAKKSLNDLGEAGGTNLGMSAEAANQLHESLASVRGMNFTGMVASIANLAASWKTAKVYAQEYNHHVMLAKAFLDKGSWVYNGPDKIMDWAGEAEALANYKEHMKLANDEMKNGKKDGGLLFTVLHSGAGKAIIAIAALGAAIMAMVAHIRLAIRTALQIKQINAEAAKIGMSVQSYQQWGYVLETVGVQADELSSFIKTLSDEQAQIAEGSEGASKAFEALGLSISDVVSMNQEQLFTETVERLQQVEDGVKRTQLAYQIFGEDASHLANVMNMNNGEMRKLIENYNLLGGGASQALVDKSNALSMSISTMKQAWTGLTNTLAELVMPIIATVINWITRAIYLVNAFIKALFHIKSAPASKSTSDMSSGMSGYKKATEGATKAVQKLKREQMGFDELNKLPGMDSSSGGSGAAADFGGGAGIPGGSFEIPKIEDLGLEKIQTFVKEVLPILLVVIGLAGAAVCMLGGNWVGALGFAAMAGIGLAVGTSEGGIWEKYLGKTSGIMASLTAIWNAFKENIKAIFTTVYAIIEAILKNVVLQFKLTWSNIEAIWSVVTGFFAAIGATIDGIFGAVGELMKGNFKGALDYIMGIFSSWKTFLGTLLSAVKTIFSNFVSWWTGVFQNAFNAIQKIFSGWSSYFKSLVNALKTIFSGVGTTISNFIANSIKSAVNGVLYTVENTVNGFISAINGAINLINKIPGVNIKKMTKIYIPKLATGGIVNSSTIANIGENGKEAVLPLENNTEWMDMLADRIAARNSGPSKIVLMVDGKELGWASINGINSITKQTGGLQLQLV